MYRLPLRGLGGSLSLARPRKGTRLFGRVRTPNTASRSDTQSIKIKQAADYAALMRPTGLRSFGKGFCYSM